MTKTQDKIQLLEEEIENLKSRIDILWDGHFMLKHLLEKKGIFNEEINESLGE